MKQIIEIDDDLQHVLNDYFEGKRAYVGLDNGVKLLEAVKNGKEIKDDISLIHTANNLAVREFEEIVVEYPPKVLCIYPEYKGKPYFGIKYKENGEEIVGYGTYKSEVLSQYLKDYFLPTTKNDLPHCQHTDKEIAKSFIEDVEAVKDQLPCGEQMDFPDTFDEFAKDYGFKDKDEVYTNGSELIPVFRVKQWLEHISITKNDLVSRNVVERIIKSPRTKEQMLSVLNSLPPQEPNTKNCESCEYYGSHHKVCNYCYKCSLWTEQESTTKNDLGVDCRSLEDIKKLIESKADDLDGVMLDASGVIIGLYFAIANDLSPVTPLPKGHWIEEFNDIEGEVRFTCSNCKKYQLFGTDFCYHCGSDNRSEE